MMWNNAREPRNAETGEEFGSGARLCGSGMGMLFFSVPPDPMRTVQGKKLVDVVADEVQAYELIEMGCGEMLVFLLRHDRKLNLYPYVGGLEPVRAALALQRSKPEVA
jgi:hypothetical protein